MPEISIVIPTFNSEKFIKTCLTSIFVQGYRNFEVIVVDNGSKDTTVDFIKKNYPQVILIENKENLGACKARNQGIEVSSGKWILTLDCDIVLEKDFLFEIPKAIKNLTTEIGMIQPKILKSDRETVYSVGVFLSSLRRFYDIGKERKDFGQFDKSEYIFGACSACALYNRKMLEEVKEDTGYFDERFFFLVEDVDLAWRAQRMGWKALYYPEAISYHYSNSSLITKKVRQCLCFRNRLLLISKNEGLRNYSKKLISLLFYDLPRLVYLFLANQYVRKYLLFNTMKNNELE